MRATTSTQLFLVSIRKPTRHWAISTARGAKGAPSVALCVAILASGLLTACLSVNSIVRDDGYIYLAGSRGFFWFNRSVVLRCIEEEYGRLRCQDLGLSEGGVALPSSRNSRVGSAPPEAHDSVPAAVDTPYAVPFEERREQPDVFFYDAETMRISRGDSAPAGFRRVPAGTFLMGTPDVASLRDEDERQIRVTLTRDTWIQETEVTQGEWLAAMGNSPSRFGECGVSCPVEMVNWYDALAYANARSRREGLAQCYELEECRRSPGENYECERVTFVGVDCEGYRLPTEAEWEYAARAGGDSAWGCGDNASCLSHTARYRDNSDGRPHSVSGMQANAWELRDMSGNVWEWVWDSYGQYPPSGATNPMNSSSGGARCVRGGGWNDEAQYLRSANRYSHPPGERFYDVGFRLARSVVP